MNDTIQANCRTYRITTEHDAQTPAPWENDDGCGIVSDWTTRDKHAGGLVLCADRSSKRFYDFAGTVAKAKAEGWGYADCEGMSAGQIAAVFWLISK